MTAAIIGIEQYNTSGADGERGLHLLRVRPAAQQQPRPVLLLHGSTLPGSIAYTLAFGGQSWLDDLASRGHDAWALDFRGYGESWRPVDDGARPCAPVADTDQAVEDLAAAIDFIRRATGADAVDIVGWSWGATVAATYAARGGALGRLVLHAPQWLRDTPSPMVTPQTLSEPYRTVDVPVFVDRWLGRIDPAARAALGGWKEELERTLAAHEPISVPNGSARDIATYWMAGRPGYDPAGITAPTLVVVGSADTDTPPALAREVFDRLGTQSRLYAEIPDGTHFTVFEPARAALFRTAAAFLADTNIEKQEFPR
ncbi:MAG: alpha/beta fold hydrolase [Sphingomonadales bacterium]|nr:MAG: alpha/beta fold hydrolase [Sphingomonadales bacterium]